VVEAALADDRVTVDFICDGVHVPPLAIKAALKAKTVDRVLLITDANVGAGLPPGIHESPWGFSIQVAEAARINDPGSAKHGALAGSALTMDVGIANLSKWLDLPQYDIWAMATRSVARAMKLDKIGDIEAGYHADMVLWDIEPSGRPRAWRTWVDGRQVYAAK
jgi:N-acetylglucosamine-6-phosphate deacetylase